MYDVCMTYDVPSDFALVLLQPAERRERGGGSMGVTIDSKCLSKRCEASWHLSNMLVSALSIAPQSPSSLSAATCSFCVSDPIVRVGTTTAVSAAAAATASMPRIPAMA